MRQSGDWTSKGACLFGSLLAMGGVACPADAENVFTNASIVADSLNMTVGACTQGFGVGLANCGSITPGSTADAEFKLGTGVEGAVFLLEDTVNAGGSDGHALFSQITSGQTDELKFTLTIAATGTSPVNFAALSVTTSGTIGDGSLSVTESGLPAGFTNGGSLSLSAAGVASTSDISNYTSSIAVNYDIKLIEGSTGTLKLTSIELIFRPAPEPISLSIFGVGLVGLGAARRARRDKARKSP